MPISGTSTAFSTKPYGGLGDDPPLGYLFNSVISLSSNNYNLRTALLSAGWSGTTPVDARITIAQNVIIGSTSVNTPAFDSGVLPSNSRLILENNGYILGKGGNGANASALAGQNGGTAINLQVNAVIQNIGIIGGGGGGGGSGGNQALLIGGSGGGGGAGTTAGLGGTGATGTVASGNAGATSAQLTGGLGGMAAGVGEAQSMLYDVAGTYSFVVPNNVFSLQIRACGAGGGGAGGMLAGCGGADHAGGGGGGGGAIFSGSISVIPAQTVSIIVGAGGLGGFARDNRNTFSGDGPTVGLEGGETNISGTNFTIILGGGGGGQIQEGNGNCGTNTTAGGAGGVAGVTGSAVIAGYTMLSGGSGGNGGTGGATGANGSSLTNFGLGGNGGGGSGGAQPGSGGGGGGASIGNGGRGGRYQTGTTTGTIGPAPGIQGSGGGGGGGEGGGYARIDGRGGDGYVLLNFSPLSMVNVRYLIVGGGGSGGSANNANAGGGGAGGFLTGTVDLSFSQAYAVSVGSGGASVTGGTINGNSGQNSSAFGFIAFGGGGGGGLGNGLAGGSGGGAGQNGPNGGAGTSGQGNAGSAPTANFGSGGGGGAGAVGTVNGGNGLQSDITGTNTYYAGGGAGQNNNNGSTFSGGLGGGGGSRHDGAGANPGFDGTNGLGGGGGGASNNGTSGAGGSGIVIVRYTSATRLFDGGTITQIGGDWLHTFSTVGSSSLTGLGQNFGGAGGNGGNIGQNGQAGGTSSSGVVGGNGGNAGNAIIHTGFTLNLNGNTPQGAIIG